MRMVKGFTMVCDLWRACFGVVERAGVKRPFGSLTLSVREEPKIRLSVGKTEKNNCARKPSRGPKNTFATKIGPNGAREGTYRAERVEMVPYSHEPVVTAHALGPRDAPTQSQTLYT